MKQYMCAWLLLLCAASVSPAAVFERDWKTPGDGLLTYDDVNQREWLDLSVSRLDQFPEPRFQNAVVELLPGGLYDEFTFAKRYDVVALAESAGIDTTTLDDAVNGAATSNIVDLLGATLQSSNSIRSVGYVDEMVVGNPSIQLAIQFYIRQQVGQAGYGLAPSDVLQGHGLMLYRVVPEPSSRCLLGTCMMAAALILRKRSHSA